MANKLASRKLWVALIGVVTGVILIISGNTTEGVTTMITSILGYLAAEGYIDGKAVVKSLIVDETVTKEENTEEQAIVKDV